MTIDERISALTMNLELQALMIEMDAEKIRSLAQVADAHQHL